MSCYLNRLGLAITNEVIFFNFFNFNSKIKQFSEREDLWKKSFQVTRWILQNSFYSYLSMKKLKFIPTKEAINLKWFYWVKLNLGKVKKVEGFFSIYNVKLLQQSSIKYFLFWQRPHVAEIKMIICQVISVTEIHQIILLQDYLFGKIIFFKAK